MEKVVYVGVYYPHTEHVLSADDILNKTTVCTMYSGLVKYGENHTEPQPEYSQRQLLHALSPAKEAPKKGTTVGYVEGILVQQKWWDQMSFEQCLVSYVQNFRKWFVKVADLDSLFHYYDLEDMGEEKDVDAFVNALVKKMCSLFTHWEHTHIDVSVK